MAADESIGEAVSYMEKNLKGEISIEEIAKHAGFSKSTLQRRFRETANATVALFLRRLRLNAAARELVETKRRILDIALDYQFESQQTFARAFKQATWLTPGEARRLKRVPDFCGLGGKDFLEAKLPHLMQSRGSMIFTSRIRELREFYHERLGFPIVEDDREFVQLNIGGAVLALHACKNIKSDPRKRSIVEVSFFTSDVEKTRKQLINRGVKVSPVALFGGLQFCKMKDPDGNTLGLSNRPTIGPLNEA
ncbi:MAG: helix-turn-helix domain-containing protein [Verrucomicrobiota bacterium]